MDIFNKPITSIKAIIIIFIFSAITGSAITWYCLGTLKILDFDPTLSEIRKKEVKEGKDERNVLLDEEEFVEFSFDELMSYGAYYPHGGVPKEISNISEDELGSLKLLIPYNERKVIAKYETYPGKEVTGEGTEEFFQLNDNKFIIGKVPGGQDRHGLVHFYSYLKIFDSESNEYELNFKFHDHEHVFVYENNLIFLGQVSETLGCCTITDVRMINIYDLLTGEEDFKIIVTSSDISDEGAIFSTDGSFYFLISNNKLYLKNSKESGDIYYLIEEGMFKEV